MDLTSTFTDDQLAIIGCFGALAACGLVAMITFHWGPQGRKQQSQQPNSVRIPVAQEKAAQDSQDSRKAA